MKILQIGPGHRPEVKDITPGLAAMQDIVGGTIQALFPFEDPVALVCNDEGKLLGWACLSIGPCGMGRGKPMTLCAELSSSAELRRTAATLIR